MNYRGPIPEDLWTVLEEVHRRPPSLKGDFTRQHTSAIAVAASMGLISVISPDGTDYHNHWRMTASGIMALAHREHLA